MHLTRERFFCIQGGFRFTEDSVMFVSPSDGNMVVGWTVWQYNGFQCVSGDWTC